MASFSEPSPRDAADKKEWMLGYLRQLVPGSHLLVCHPRGKLRARIAHWARLCAIPLGCRIPLLSDLAVLTDSDVRRLIDDLGITLCSLPEALAPAAG
jgi:hypothetical protein